MIKASATTLQTFYKKLAHLFYAVAASDKDISSEEISALHEEVKKVWVPVEKTHDDYGTDAAFQIEFAFDWMMENVTNAEKAFKAFETYYKENPALFDEDIIQRIYATAEHIARAFPGHGKGEHRMLLRTHALLGRTTG